MAARRRIYLDHNATTPLDPRVREAMVGALAGVSGNPSSIHEEGRAARDVVERARRQVAALLGAEVGDVVFTSGGTEADALGVIGLAEAAARGGARRRVITTAIEHPAVAGAAEALAERGFEVVATEVSPAGRIDTDALERACASGAAVVAVALANHELGTVQPVADIAEVAHRAGALVHCDAVQAAGKLPLAAAAAADAVAISAHKIGGPTGVGALRVRGDVDVAPLVAGGHQERERRPGTENVAGIAGFGEAARIALSEWPEMWPRVRALAGRLEEGMLAIGGVRVHGAGAARIGNTVNAGFEGALGEVIVWGLDLAGIAASTGAACTSGQVAPSPVLLGMGLSPQRAREAVRFSLGVTTTSEDVDAVLEEIPAIVSRARAFR